MLHSDWSVRSWMGRGWEGGNAKGMERPRKPPLLRAEHKGTAYGEHINMLLNGENFILLK